jgi:hypothetical protein
MVNVASFENEQDAVQARDRLEQAGLHPEIQNESALQTFWMSHEHASVKLRVPNEELDQAIRLVHELEEKGEPVMEKAVHCPECHSMRVQYPQYTRKWYLPGLVHFIASRFQARYYCQDCHAVWSPGETRENELTPQI